MSDLRNEIIPDDLIQAPLKLGQNFDPVVKQLEKIIKLGKSMDGAIGGAKSAEEIKKIIAALNNEQKALEKTQQTVKHSMQETSELTSKFGDELKGALGPFGELVNGFQNGVNKAREFGNGLIAAARASGVLKVAMLAIPLFALIAGITSLVTYFKKTEEGAQKLRVIMAVLGAVFDNFVDLVIDLGKYLANLSLDKVKQQFIDIGNAIKEYILGRVQMFLGGLDKLAKAFDFLKQGEFKKAAKEAADGFKDMALAANPVAIAWDLTSKAVNTAIEKGKEFYNEIKKDAQDAIKIQERENEFFIRRRNWLVEEGKLINELNRLREEAAEVGDDEVKKIQLLTQAQRVLNKLEEGRVSIAQEELSIAKARGELDRYDSEEELQHLAELERQLADARNAGAAEQRKIAKEITALRQKMLDEEEKNIEDAKKARLKALDEVVVGIKQKTQQQLNEINRGLEEEVASIQRAVIAGYMTRKEGDEAILQLRKSSAAKLISENIRLLETELNQILEAENKKLAIQSLTDEERTRIQNESAKEQQAVSEKISDLQVKLTNTIYENLEEQQNSTLDKTISFLEKVEGHFNNFGAAIGEMFSALTDNRLQQIDKEQKAYTDAVDRQLEALSERVAVEGETDEQRLKREEENEAAKSVIQNEARRKEEEFDRKRLEARRKAAIYDKVVSATQAAIAGSLAVLRFLADPGGVAGLGLSIAAGATAAIQVAAILARNIPAYEKGGTHKGGLAKVAEKGIELIKFPNNRLALTPAHETIMNLPAGTEIKDHETTMQMLAQAGLQVDSYKMKNGDLNSSLGRYFGSLENTIRNKAYIENNFTKEGFEHAVVNGQARTYWLKTLWR